MAVTIKKIESPASSAKANCRCEMAARRFFTELWIWCLGFLSLISHAKQDGCEDRGARSPLFARAFVFDNRGAKIKKGKERSMRRVAPILWRTSGSLQVIANFRFAPCFLRPTCVAPGEEVAILVTSRDEEDRSRDDERPSSRRFVDAGHVIALIRVAPWVVYRALACRHGDVALSIREHVVWQSVTLLAWSVLRTRDCRKCSSETDSARIDRNIFL